MTKMCVCCRKSGEARKGFFTFTFMRYVKTDFPGIVLCSECRAQWQSSPEHKRSRPQDMMDFIHRVQAETLNGGKRA